jgi:hypothetical protein
MPTRQRSAQARLALSSGPRFRLQPRHSCLEPGLRGGVDCLTLLRAIAEVLEAFGASLRIALHRGDVFDAVETSSIFSAAVCSVDQLLWVVASQTTPIASTRRMS